MYIRLIRPVAVAAALALTFSAGFAPMTASAGQQVFGQWSTQNNDQNRHQITGVVTYFSQFDLRIAAGNGNGLCDNGYGNDRKHRHRRDNADGQSGNGNGRNHRLRRDNANGQNSYGQCDDGQSNDGQYGNGQNNDDQYGDGQDQENDGQYGNGQDQDNDGQYGSGQDQENDGQYGNGQYGNGQYGYEQRIRLHQGTVVNPRGTNLRNGMQLRISGRRNYDGTFEADRIDVINGQGGYYRR